METSIVGECYLPMISDWWRQGNEELKKQYLSPINNPAKWPAQYGGSCDNDVHEHFKCLMETVFGKAFVHETEDGYVTYNCKKTQDGFETEDSYVKEWIVYAIQPIEITLNGKKQTLKQGLQVITEGDNKNAM